MKEPKLINPRSLNSLGEQGRQIHLVDVRTPAEYRSGHAAGSVSIPLDQLSPEKLAVQLGGSAAGRDQPLFLTCQSGLRARQAAERLMQSGLENLYLLDGGTEAWMKAGLPMQRCGSAISLERQVQITIGILLVLKVLFGFTIHELFFAAIPIIGAGLIVAGITRWCGMARLISMMPWNRGVDCSRQVTI
jgi:rhodanese-related sulfurtransferase